MASWTSGYVADIGYTFGFYRELTPSLLSFVALVRGQQGPDAAGPLTYCELGCGQGFSMNLLAAANPHARFYATDFNPSQIGGARQLAAEAGLSNVFFSDTSFADFASQPDLPDQFDVISLHGIYSWISEENRRAIVDFIGRKLKVGGLVYVSYNCLPGWSAAAPMRQLMYMHTRTGGGPTAPRLESALTFVEKVMQSEAAFFKVNPGMKERFERVKGQNRNYLAHEYLNDDWNLLYHSDVAGEMSAAKLSFLGSAALLDQVDAINLTSEQQQLMTETTDPLMRETLRDFMINQQFRRDVFVKGAVPLSARRAQETWLDQRFALSVLASDIEMKVKGARGEATLQEDVYSPVLKAFADGPKSVRELFNSDKTIADLGWARLQQALAILVGAGHLHPSLPARNEGARVKSTKAFNLAVCQRARDSADLQFLASPVTGGGVQVARFPQLFMLALAEGKKQSDDWAEFAWKVISDQGQRILKEGKALETPEENVAELKVQAAAFAEKQLPVLRQLQIV